MARSLEEFKEWLEDQGLSSGTVGTYVRSMRSILRRKSPMAVLRDDKAMATKTLYLAALRHWALFTDDSELLSQVNSSKTKRTARAAGSKMPKVVEPLTDEEMDKFMAGLEALKASKGKEGIALWIWPAISMLVVYGLRAGVDLCNIQRAEVTSALRTGVLRLWTKGGRIRELPAGVIQEELEWLVSIPNWSVLSDLIAPNAKKPQESAYSAVSKMIKVVAQVGGLDPDTIHPHRLRHAAAMRLYESSGHDLHLVQYLLGHSQIDTTAKYLRVNRMDELNDQLMRVKRNKSRIEDD